VVIIEIIEQETSTTTVGCDLMHEALRVANCLIADEFRRYAYAFLENGMNEIISRLSKKANDGSYSDALQTLQTSLDKARSTPKVFPVYPKTYDCDVCDGSGITTHDELCDSCSCGACGGEKYFCGGCDSE
jgi:DnaJ-class molecular chaperone